MDIKKTKEQLNKDLVLKINGIKSLLFLALKCELESDERLEYSNIIASSLRAILYGDRENDYKSLIHRTNYDKRLYFPMYNWLKSLDVSPWPTYNLLGFSINENGTKAIISDDLFKTGGFWGSYLTFDSWLNEVVIDTKEEEIEPLSRLLIIKIIADSAGSHVDNRIEPHLYSMMQHRMFPVVVINGKESPRNIEVEAKSVLCESILAIANELINSFEIWPSIHLNIIGPSNFEVRIQKYIAKKSEYELIKYGIHNLSMGINTITYNSNKYYECEVYSKRVSKYKFIWNHRHFETIIVDYHYILEGEYLGKSIYK